MVKYGRLSEILRKHEELLIYLVVGVLTTVVSWIVCFSLERFVLDPNDAFQNFVINTYAWVAGVGFAYPMNRRFVFKSRNPEILKEFFGFAGSRLSTWILDIFIMWLTVNVFEWNFWICKIMIASVIVTVLNYCFSKLIIFKK